MPMNNDNLSQDTTKTYNEGNVSLSTMKTNVQINDSNPIV